MSSTTRCLVPALVVALAALILGSGSSLGALGMHAAPALLVLLTHVWVVAVAERTCPDRGGQDVKRFPLGPRLFEGSGGLPFQLLVPILMLGLAGRSLPLAVGGSLLVVVLATASLRRMLPFVLPALAAIWAVSTMPEFNTLGDLLDSARHWVFGLLGLILGCVVVGGPLLRTDMGGRLSSRGKLVCLLAALPGYLLGVFLAARPDLLGAPPDLLALAAGLLLGGLIQSLVASLLGKAGDLQPRDPRDFPTSQPARVGQALMLACLPVLALVAFGWVALPPAWAALAPPAAWSGLTAMLMIVPALPAAMLIAWGLDRCDGLHPPRWIPMATTAALGLWFLFAPLALGWVLGAEGLAGGLRSLFPGVPAPWPVQVGDRARAALGGSALGGALTLHGLPAADLARAVTLMWAAGSGLVVHQLRHAVEGGRGGRWGTLVLGALLCALGALLLMPRVGPVGAPLAVTASCLAMLIVDSSRQAARAASARALDVPAG